MKLGSTQEIPHVYIVEYKGNRSKYYKPWGSTHYVSEMAAKHAMQLCKKELGPQKEYRVVKYGRIGK